jgi:A/G-specific adenine glycosylase
LNRVTINEPENKEARFVQLLLEWGEKNKRSFPWRKDRTPYKVLMAEILLQRTPANRVATFFPKFVEKFPSPKSIVTTDIDSLRQFFHPMGLKKRVKWLTSLMKEVCDRYDCKVPNQEKELVKLPGVGPYTARAILCFGFGRDVSMVDVNVARVLSRVFFGSDVRKRPSEDEALWLFAARIVPKGLGPQYNEALLDYAALVCKRKPKCDICPIAGVCEYFK